MGSKEDYIKGEEKNMEDLTDAEKISYLLERVKYWYGSALNWRKFYEEEKKTNETP